MGDENPAIAIVGTGFCLMMVLVLLWLRRGRIERHLAAARRAGPNDFQRSLDLGQVIVKNASDELCPPLRKGRLRVVSWNVERGHRPEQLADYLESARADVICLQEVDWNNRRTRSADVLDHLATHLGMRGYFGIEFLEICTPLRPDWLAGGGVTGNAILTNSAAVSVFRIDLPVATNWEFDWNAVPAPFSGRLWRRIRREKRNGRRFALAAEIRIAERTLVICSTHFENFTGGIAGRFAQYQGIAAELERRYGDSAVRVIAGDFNTYDSPLSRFFSADSHATALGKPNAMDEARWWEAHLLPKTGYVDPFDADAWTFQVTPFFRRKLDWITVCGGRALEHGVGPFGSTDHRPIWADLEW
jgi:endonuclease/exonuclease/phosphatase family metal-dependent hydrolase